MTEQQTAPPKAPLFFCSGAEYRVFTNTHFDGANFFATGCSEWSMTAGGASWGLADSVTKDWSSTCNSPDQGCDVTALLYCFQQ